MTNDVRRSLRTLIVVLAAAAAPACASHRGPVAGAPCPCRHTDENLNAVLWMQTSVEYEAAARQAYRLAARNLDQALKDPSWTAAVEQTGDTARLRPAVVLDLDETVFDNSGFQARRVIDSTAPLEDAWTAWCRERKAGAVPGALEFLHYARDVKDVAIVFITNRSSTLDEDTIANLANLGVRLDGREDEILSLGERPEWSTPDKTARRQVVAATHRILLLIGDDLGDFVGAGATLASRQALASKYADRWGRQWIALPNPAYGSWERAILSDVTGGDADTLAAKYRMLDPMR